jgi:hypothetical protein
MSQPASTASNSQSPLDLSLKTSAEALTDSAASSAHIQRPAINPTFGDILSNDLGEKRSGARDDHGHTVNQPDSFCSNGLQFVGGDYAISPEPESDAYEEATPISKKSTFPLAEFLEDLGDEDSELDDSALPLFARADENLTGDSIGLYSQLKSVGVAAFRENAHSMFAYRPGTCYSQTSPIAASAAFALPAVPIPDSSITSHKRKISTTPYQDEKIYGDVTPVERKVVHVAKRRKTIT